MGLTLGPPDQPPTMADEIAGTELEVPGQGTEGPGTELRWGFHQTHNHTHPGSERAQTWPAVPRIGAGNEETVCHHVPLQGKLGLLPKPSMAPEDAVAVTTSLPWPCPTRVGKQLLRVSGKMRKGLERLGEEYRWRETACWEGRDRETPKEGKTEGSGGT